VGEDADSDPQTFFVHSELVMSRSKFFAKALKNYTPLDQAGDDKHATSSVEGRGCFWKEGHEGVVRLPVDKPVVFAHYIQLIYTGVLPMPDEPEKPQKWPSGTSKNRRRKRRGSARMRCKRQ